MKTIITTLPIYDKLAKQCYERSKKAGHGVTPIICPRHRLPSFQWKDDIDGAASVSSIELVSQNYDGKGDGLFTSWDVHSFDSSYSGSYLNFHGINVGVGAWGVVSDSVDLVIGDVIRIYGFASGAAGGYPYAYINSNPHDLALSTGGKAIGNGIVDITLTAKVAGITEITIAGIGPIDFTFSSLTIERIRNIKNITDWFPTLPVIINGYFTYNGDTLNYLLDPGVYYLKITTNNNKVYYSDYFQVDCVFGDDEGLPPTEIYSEKYLILNFFNSCNLGDILYQNGFLQTLWFKSEPMEMSFPEEEEGQKNGENTFVRTFARQVKQYMTRTNKMPDYMVDVFNRMKLHDNIELTDLVGDIHSVYNLSVEHEWLWDDKYLAKLDLTFDYNEVVIVAACCENTTQGSVTIDNGGITIDNDG